jgi:predicted nucleotidyltransferase/DNA-binding HxlR family transcriptional regulator
MFGKTAQLFGITAQSGSLAELLSSKVKAEVFRLLFGLHGQPLHLRELERRSGLAIGTVRQELNRLAKLGLVEPRVDGNRRYYSAREDHPLYPEIRGLVLKTTGLADQLREALKKTTSVRVAFVFGSVAQARERAHSDIDLLIVGELGLRELIKLLHGIADAVGREINPKVFTPEEFRRRKRIEDPFLSRVLAAPRIIVIGNEDELGSLG